MLHSPHHRIMCLLLCAGLIFSLAACAGADTALPEETAAALNTEASTPESTAAEPETSASPATSTEPATTAAPPATTAASTPASTVLTTAAPKPSAVFCAASPTYPECKTHNFNTLSDENPVDKTVVNAVKVFAYKTASEVLKNSAGNAVYSPISLYMALALTGAGAGGETKKEFDALLGFWDLTQSEISAGMNALFRSLYLEGGDEAFRIANSLWMEHSVPFCDAYLKDAAENYFASLYSVDFGDTRTGEEMSNWVANNTDGLLKPDIRADKNQILSVINTVWFKGKWRSTFESKDVAEGLFSAEGKQVKAQFMSKRLKNHMYWTGSGFTASKLYMNNGASMVFALPDKGVTPESLLTSAGGVSAIFNQWGIKDAQVNFRIPKFDFGVKMDLCDTLKTLGLTQAFDKKLADFSALTDEEASVSGVNQEACIQIDEYGVTAAAFTEVRITTKGIVKYPDTVVNINLDRPFVFGVMAPDGTLLFAGICRNPAS